MLEPKIKKSLSQISYQYKEDLEQDIKVLILSKLQQNVIRNVPGFFEFIEEDPTTGIINYII